MSSHTVGKRFHLALSLATALSLWTVYGAAAQSSVTIGGGATSAPTTQSSVAISGSDTSVPTAKNPTGGPTIGGAANPDSPASVLGGVTIGGTPVAPQASIGPLGITSNTTTGVTVASAQASRSSTAGLVLELRAPTSEVAGNVTFYGTAVDSRSGQAASRVAVYDGTGAAAPYLADVSLDKAETPGGPHIGFTLILNSRSLSEGPHTLMFVADFPGGASATAATGITVENRLPYGDDNSGRRDRD